MNEVTLVYFQGCPEAEKVRTALIKAGVKSFKTVLINDLTQQDPLRKLSSPTVLEGSEIIFGVRTHGEVSTCTFDLKNFIDEESLIRRFSELANRSKL